MNQNLLQKLKKWRKETSQRDGVDAYMILHNKTIEAITETLPQNEEEFKAINGLGDKKFEKYGTEILSLVNGTNKEDSPRQTEDKENEPYTVGAYLNLLNANLWKYKGRIQGEVSSLDIRQNFLYFSIKDKEDASVLSCFMCKNNYDLCSITMEEGMEIIVDGFPEVYKPNGRLSFQVSTIELVGEGALKLAYDKLRKKLEAEGLFAVERKKVIPDLPQKIGLITSEAGAVIHDFQSNLGKYGYKIKFMDSRVEGQAAIKEIVSAVEYFKDKDIDVLVIIRGGGSLESLQAFNNEVLVRKIAGCKIPVLCGVGHDQDIPLASLVADKAASTPTAVTTILNESWNNASSDVSHLEKDLMYKYQKTLNDTNNRLEELSRKIEKRFTLVLANFNELKIKIKSSLNGIGNSIKSISEQLSDHSLSLIRGFNSGVNQVTKEIDEYPPQISKNFANQIEKTNNFLGDMEATLKIHNPMHQLKLGYSIVSVGGKIIKNIDQVNVGDQADIRVSDGQMSSEVININKIKR